MKPSSYDYSTAGFDGFLSRSIDDLSQTNLDSAGPLSTQLAYDRTQVTGMLGDTWRVGTITVDGKTSQIAVKDTLKLGETDTGDGMALFDSQGKTILDIVKDDKNRARLAVTDDGNIKRLFAGRGADGRVVAKLSQNGVDVEEASDDQLVWSSDFNLFKIVKKIPTATAQFTTTYDGTNTTGSTLLTVPHGLTYDPIVQVFVRAKFVNSVGGGLITSTYIPLPIVMSNANSLNAYLFPNASDSTNYFGVSVLFGVDATNVYVQAFLFLPGNSADTMASIPVSIFLLRETAT